MSALSICVVAAVNDDEVLARNLASSPMIAGGDVPLACYRDATSASQAYNLGLDESEADIVVFAHQDVFLPAGWDATLRDAIAVIEADDPDWGVIGAWGLDEVGEYVGNAWSSGLSRKLGGKLVTPRRAVAIDEFVIVLRRASGLRFDENLPHFHFYAADIVLTAREAGLSTWVADLPAIHNSKPVQSYAGGYTRAWDYMRRKWRQHIPLRTLTVPLSASRLPLWRAKFWLRRSLKGRLARATDPKTDPRELLHHLDL